MPKKMVLEELTPADISGRHVVLVKIKPTLPQEEMQKAQLAAAFRAPGPDGSPLVDDLTLLEDVLGLDYPDTIRRRVAGQMLPAKSQAVQKLLVAAQEQAWMNDNPSTLELAEERLGKSMDLTPDQLKQLVGVLVKMELMRAQGQDPQIEQLLMAAGQQGGAPALPAGPGGMSPQVLPSQLQMTPDEVLPDGATLPASQARRGRPVNNANEG